MIYSLQNQNSIAIVSSNFFHTSDSSFSQINAFQNLIFTKNNVAVVNATSKQAFSSRLPNLQRQFNDTINNNYPDHKY